MNLPQISLLKVGAFLFMAGIGIVMVNAGADAIEAPDWLRLAGIVCLVFGLAVGFAIQSNMNELE